MLQLRGIGGSIPILEKLVSSQPFASQCFGGATLIEVNHVPQCFGGALTTVYPYQVYENSLAV
ncbi:hypothetical protein [Thermococcus sp.]